MPNAAAPTLGQRRVNFGLVGDGPDVVQAKTNAAYVIDGMEAVKSRPLQDETFRSFHVAQCMKAQELAVELCEACVKALQTV